VSGLPDVRATVHTENPVRWSRIHPWTGGAKRRKACCAEMMTSVPLPPETKEPRRRRDTAKAEGKLRVAVHEASVLAQLDCWTHQTGRAGTPTPAHAVFAAASSCLSREERLRFWLRHRCPWWSLGNRLGAGARGEASVRTTGTRARNLTGAMLPRSRDGMVPRKDIDVQLLATKQW